MKNAEMPLNACVILDRRKGKKMSITDVKFVQGFIRMCNDGWEQGWHERNGGNLSYRMKAEEVEEVKKYFSEDGSWREIGTSVPELAGEYLDRKSVV